MPQASTSGWICKSGISRVWKTYLHTPGQSSTSHKSPEEETTPLFIGGWMDKQVVIYPYNAISFSLEREEILSHVITPMKLYTMWNQPVPRKEKSCMIPPI